MAETEPFGEFPSAALEWPDWARWFRATLSNAAESIEADASVANQRATFIDLLSQLIDVSESIPMPDLPMDPLDLVPLQRLLVALVEIDNGHVHPVLDPSNADARFRQDPSSEKSHSQRRPGRRPSSFRTQTIRAHGVAFVRLLVEAGMPVAAAEKEVAKAFSASGLRGSKAGSISSSTVHTWAMNADKHGDRPGEGDLASAYVALWKRNFRGSSSEAQVLEWLEHKACDLAKDHQWGSLTVKK